MDKTEDHLFKILFCFYFIGLGRGVHCGIYKGSYNTSNISYLNSLSPPFSFLSPHTIFIPYSPSYTLSPPPPSSLLLKNIILSDVSQVQKVKGLMFSLICGI
jgi:hypothetical protein